ncbi:hypothetical protein COS83_03195, partial [archaeon CG07_land_8_20_14_0_80_38_8]
MEGKTIVQMDDVKRFYKMGEETIKALNGINIIIEEGELIAIFGPSGSGKSTLMHIIGLLDTHIQGRIKINNIDSKDLSKREITHLRSNNIGFIFQSFFLTPNLTALENVELPMMLVDENEAFRKKRAEELLR